MSIAENLKNLKLQISINCQKAGREADSCTLIAVSKTKPLEQITEAISAGQKHFGENYVQEALQKISNFSKLESPPIWHFIGHLQSNKAHQVVGAFHLIHSVDRISLAKVLNQEAKKKNIVQSILLQINVGDEDSKSGVRFEEAETLFRQILDFENLKLCGLMCLPPLVDTPAAQREYFQTLRSFMEDQKPKLSDSQKSNFKILSMGTTHDFESAIFEGATHVRIGTAIFGQRENQ